MPVIRDYQDENGILIFDSSLDHRSTYDAHHLNILKEAESSHFWFDARRETICRAFEQCVEKDSSILEIGGGTGYVAEKLLRMGYAIEMADIHLRGLEVAKQRGIEKLYQFDLFLPPFREEFDVICLFDVLEHLEDEHVAIESIKSMLKPKGKIILTVPAHMWLWNRDDAIAGHKKRYTKKGLEELFIKANLRTIYIRYFFISILPLLLLRKYLQKDHGNPIKPGESIQADLHPLFNRLLRRMIRVEHAIEKYLPNLAGGSLIAIAEMTSSI